MNSIPKSDSITKQLHQYSSIQIESSPPQPLITSGPRIDPNILHNFIQIRTPSKINRRQDESRSSENDFRNIQKSNRTSSYLYHTGKSSKKYFQDTKQFKYTTPFKKSKGKQNKDTVFKTYKKDKDFSDKNKYIPISKPISRSHKGSIVYVQRIQKDKFETEGKRNKSKKIIRSSSISYQPRISKFVCPIKTSKKINFKKLIRSELCLKSLVKYQSRKNKEIQNYFGVSKIKRYFGKNPENLLKKGFNAAILNDIFPMIYQSEGTYSEFSSSSLEEGESKAKMKYFQNIENLEKIKNIRKEEKKKNRVQEDNQMYNLLFGPTQTSSSYKIKQTNKKHHQLRRTKTSDFSNHPKTVSENKRKYLIYQKTYDEESDNNKVTPKYPVDSQNAQLFESFSKSLKKNKKQKLNLLKTSKKGPISKKDQRKKVNRKPNKSVHLFKTNKQRHSCMNNKKSNRLPFHSREKKYKKLFNHKNSSPIKIINPKIERLIYLNKKGEPILYSSMKHKNKDKKTHQLIQKDNFGIYTNNKIIPDVNLQNDPFSVSYQNVDFDIEFKLNRNQNPNLFYNANQNDKLGKLTFKSNELINTCSNSNSQNIPNPMNKLTSNCKIKSGTSKNGGLSSLSSTQDFLKCDSSYPSLVLNNLNSNNSLNKEKSRNKLDSKTNYMSPIKDTEEIYQNKKSNKSDNKGYARNKIRNKSISKIKSNIQKYENEYNFNEDDNIVESNIFESIFSFKNEKINFLKEKDKKHNLYNFDIENNINVYIGSKNKPFKTYHNKNINMESGDSKIHKRKTSRKEITKLGKLIEKQKKYIESKSNITTNKSIKENFREIRKLNNIIGQENSSEKPKDPNVVNSKNKYVFENILNQKNKKNNKFYKNNSKNSILVKKSYNSLIRSEYEKNPKKIIKYSRNNQINSIHKNIYGNIYQSKKSSKNDNFMLSNDYNRANVNLTNKQVKTKLINKKNKHISPIIIENEYNKLHKDLLSYERNLSQEHNIKLNSKYKKNIFPNTNILRNKSEVFNRKNGNIPNHLISNHSKKKVKGATTNENSSYDKQQFKSLKKHKIILVPESMVTSSDLSSGSKKNRNKIIRKKNYSLFQRDSKMFKFGVK